jgi:hypothetical protein
MGCVRGSCIFGILVVLGTPSLVVLDDDRRDGPDWNALAAHPFDVSVGTGAVVAVWHVRPILRKARPASDRLLVLSRRKPGERYSHVLGLAVVGAGRVSDHGN